jgi:maltose O-acetyltransferase
MGPINRIKHLWSRYRLLMNSGYYSQYLKKQGVKIGKDSVVHYPLYVDGRLPYLLEIGDNVIISLNVTILTHDAATAYAGDMVKVGRVIIHDHSFIGANSTILCDVEIGPDSIVAAGSVVTKNVLPGSVYGGNPAKFICTLDDFIKKHRKNAENSFFLEGQDFPHAYLVDSKKRLLKEHLTNKNVYFCSRLPKDGNI